MGHWLKPWIKRIVSWTNAAAAFAIGADKLGWPSPDFWASWQDYLIWVLGAAVALPIFQVYITETSEKRKTKELTRYDDIRAFLSSTLIILSNECGTSWQHTGIQAFRVAGPPWARRQVRISKLRLSSTPSSGIKWTEGKGVIGACWREKALQWEDLASGSFAALAQISRDRWHTLGNERTFGLSYDEYKTLGQKYGTVAAAPIMSKSDVYIGCITLDTPHGVTLRNLQRAKEALASTADLVSRYLEA